MLILTADLWKQLHTLIEFNKLQSNINFTIEKEQYESINFLDLTIHHENKNLQFSIYQKPTQIDIIIPNSSCHPYKHKLSGTKYLLNQLHTYPITEKAKDIEENTIKNILYNEYDRNQKGDKNKIYIPIYNTKKQIGLPSHTVGKK
jgi:hypothetical protein